MCCLAAAVCAAADAEGADLADGAPFTGAAGQKVELPQGAKRRHSSTQQQENNKKLQSNVQAGKNTKLLGSPCGQHLVLHQRYNAGMWLIVELQEYTKNDDHHHHHSVVYIPWLLPAKCTDDVQLMYPPPLPWPYLPGFCGQVALGMLVLAVRGPSG